MPSFKSKNGKTIFTLCANNFIFACQQKYETISIGDPNELILISGQETVERVKAGNFNYGYASFKNANGNELTAYDKAFLNEGLLAQDFYEDQNGVIKEDAYDPFNWPIN